MPCANVRCWSAPRRTDRWNRARSSASSPRLFAGRVLKQNSLAQPAPVAEGAKLQPAKDAEGLDEPANSGNARSAANQGSREFAGGAGGTALVRALHLSAAREVRGTPD